MLVIEIDEATAYVFPQFSTSFGESVDFFDRVPFREDELIDADQGIALIGVALKDLIDGCSQRGTVNDPKLLPMLEALLYQ